MTTDLLAILVSDLVGSTATRTQLGEERADDLQRVHDEILRNAVVAGRGEVVKGTGDGIMATFRSATDALAAGVVIQQQLDAYSRRADAIAPITPRVGISVGDVVHQDDDIFGSAVVEAARLADAAEPRQIFCSELVRSLARGRGGFEFELVGLLELKGMPDAVATCRVQWERVGVGDLHALGLPEELLAAARSPFVGRDAELGDALALALGSDAAEVVWILGEPGMGKTRFAAEVAARSHDNGTLVLYGRCDEMVNDPFQPFIQALRWFAAGIGDDALERALGADPAPLIRLVPEIGTRVPRLLEEIGRTTEVEQYRLFESVRSWLASAGLGRPIVLVVDDAHWADRPTTAMLTHVLRSAAQSRLCVLATARDTTPDASELLADVVDDLARTRRSRTLPLVGLNAEQVGSLFAGIDIEPSEAGALAIRIADETAGNPLFVSAVIASLHGGAAPDSDVLPADVRAAVRHRVRRLDAEAQELLQVAALVGLEFSLAIAAAAYGASEAECLNSVEQAVKAALVDEIAVDRFRFTHALVRDALEGELSASRRARLHASIADAIEHCYGDDLSEHLRVLARHFAQAGSPEQLQRALECARQSADRASDQLAFEVAVNDLSFALEIVARLPNRSPEVRYELLMKKGQAQVMAALHRPALVTFAAAADVARAFDDPVPFARAAILYEEASWRPGLLGYEAVALLREAADRQLPDDVAIFGESSLARAMAFCGDAAVANQIAADALARARATGDAALICHGIIAYTESSPLDRPMDSEALFALALEATELAIEANIPFLDGLMLAQAVYAYVDLGDIDNAKQWLERTEEIAERKGLRFDRYLIMSLEQIFAFGDGDLARAEAGALELLEFGHGLGEDISGTHGVQMFLIRREQGRLRELAPVVRMVLQANPAAAMWRPGLILLLAGAGLRDEARSLLEEFATDRFAQLPRDAMFAPALSMLAEAAAAVDAVEIGRDLATLLGPWELSSVWIGPTVGFLGSAARYLGLLAALDNRRDDAEALFDRSLDYHRRLRMPVWIAHSLADLATFHADGGDTERARPCATEARLLAERHGLGGIAQQLDVLALE